MSSSGDWLVAVLYIWNLAAPRPDRATPKEPFRCVATPSGHSRETRYFIDVLAVRAGGHMCGAPNLVQHASGAPDPGVVPGIPHRRSNT